MVVVPLTGRVGRSRSIKRQLPPPLSWNGSGWHELAWGLCPAVGRTGCRSSLMGVGRRWVVSKCEKLTLSLGFSFQKILLFPSLFLFLLLKPKDTQQLPKASFAAFLLSEASSLHKESSSALKLSFPPQKRIVGTARPAQGAKAKLGYFTQKNKKARKELAGPLMTQPQ